MKLNKHLNTIKHINTRKATLLVKLSNSIAGLVQKFLIELLCLCLVKLKLFTSELLYVLTYLLSHDETLWNMYKRIAVICPNLYQFGTYL